LTSGWRDLVSSERKERLKNKLYFPGIAGKRSSGEYSFWYLCLNRIFAEMEKTIGLTNKFLQLDFVTCNVYYNKERSIL
jgi:hypothetical protein